MYTFDEIEGNAILIKRLKSIILSGRVFHAYIFDGQKGMGKRLIAKTFAKAVMCEKSGDAPCNECISCRTFDTNNHTDVIYVKASKAKNVGIEDIREQIGKTVGIKPYKYNHKIYIIENADTMTQQAQNALLKTIEEPPPYAMFLLLSNNYNNFLETILSRCIMFRLKPLSFVAVKNYLICHVGLTEDKAVIFASFSGGNIGQAVDMASSEQFILMRNDIIDIISNLEEMDLTQIFKTEECLEAYKSTINEALDMAYLFYRDALAIKTWKDTRYVIQKDILMALGKVSESLTFKRLIKNTETIFEAKKQLKQNANFQLAIEMMLLKLKGL